jgi:hypothetical protein
MFLFHFLKCLKINDGAKMQRLFFSNFDVGQQMKSVVFLGLLGVSCKLAAPGSLRPLRTVRATFTAYGSGTFKAVPVKGNPAVLTIFIRHKLSNLVAFFC